MFVSVLGMVGGTAAMALANRERLKLRIHALEQRLVTDGVAQRGQSRRVRRRFRFSDFME